MLEETDCVECQVWAGLFDEMSDLCEESQDLADRCNKLSAIVLAFAVIGWGLFLWKVWA